MVKYDKCLVIDTSHMARSIITTERAYVIAYKGNAVVIHEHPELFGLVNKSLKIYKPSIIKVNHYVNIRHQKVALNRENIYRRDDYTCAYCGGTRVRELTLDHIIPQSKGGEDSWYNLITCCKECNQEKADLDLDEYDKDIIMPQRPHYLMLMRKIKYIHDEWKHYFLY